MARHRLLAALVPLTLVVAACSGDDDDAGGDAAAAEPAVTVRRAWARTTPPGTTVGAVYFVAEATTDDAVVAATVDDAVADAVELHRMVSDGDADAGAAMSMEQVDRLDLPAGDEIDVDEAGYHVMLVGLAGALADGETFELTLDFERAPDQTVTIEVRDFPPDGE